MTTARRALPLALSAALLCAPGRVADAQQAVAPPTPAAGTNWLVFVDDLHIDFRSTGRVRSLLRTIAGTLIADGDLAAGFSSPSSIAVDFTGNRDRIVAKLGTLTTGSTSAAVERRVFELIATVRQSRARIFAIDADRVRSPVDADSALQTYEWQSYRDRARNSLRLLAESSGGFAVFEDEDLAGGLSRIASAMRP